MSHSVKVQVALNTSRELGLIKEMEQEIDSCAGVYKEYLNDVISNAKNEISKAKKELQELGNVVVDSDQSQVLINYQGRIDSLMKTVANISSAIDYGSVYETIVKNASKEVNEIIAKNGVMAMIAASTMEDNHEVITAETLSNEINKIRTEKLSKEERDLVISKLENTIMEIEIPIDSKSTLLEQTDELSSPQELMDLIAMLKSHELNYKRMLSNAKKFEEALVSQGFKLSGRKDSVNAKGELVLHINACKEGTKDLSIELDSSMGAQWQHGDYEHHMCKADTEGFLEELKKVDVKLSSPVILRTHSNSKPMQKSAKLNEREM